MELPLQSHSEAVRSLHSSSSVLLPYIQLRHPGHHYHCTDGPGILCTVASVAYLPPYRVPLPPPALTTWSWRVKDHMDGGFSGLLAGLLQLSWGSRWRVKGQREI